MRSPGGDATLHRTAARGGQPSIAEEVGMLREDELELREVNVTDAYTYWIDECIDVHEAYESWSNAPAGEASTAAFAAYCAALEREEYASLCLQALAA
jgi:hypothetical protein